MKVNDLVTITATESDLEYIPTYNRNEIIKNPVGIVKYVGKGLIEVRCYERGIWLFDKKFVKLKENNNV